MPSSTAGSARAAHPASSEPVDDGLDPAVAALVRASFARQGLMRLIGAEMLELRPGSCTIRLPYSAAVGQQAGFFHGGVVGAVGDSAGGYAALTTMPPGSEVLSAEYKINFLRPAAGSYLLAVGTVLRAGRTLTVARVDVHCGEDGAPVLCAAIQQTLVRVVAAA